jgi:hypothetical protein
MGTETEPQTQTGSPTPSETRSLDLVAYWSDRPLFTLSVVLFAIGIVLGVGALSAYAYGQYAMWQILGILALGIVVISGIGVYFLRLSKKQHYYLNLISHEKSELEGYQKLLSDDDFRSKVGDRSIDLDETISKIEVAQTQLDRAERAVYREGYVAFLSSFYRANILRIFIYDLLDATRPQNEPQYVDWALDIGQEKLPDCHIHEEGTVEVSSGEETETRLENLSKWLWSTSRLLPEPERSEVEEYLLGPDNRPKQSPSSQALYRAGGVVHAWDIQRLSGLMSLKRALRILVPVLAGLLTVVVAAEIFTTRVDQVIDGPIGSWFVLAVVFAGFLGSMFSMALFMRDTSSEITSYRSIPDPSILRETVATSLLIGGTSALVLYILLLSNIGAVVFTEDVRTDPLAILLIAFLAGYSERLVQRSLDKAEEMVEQTDDERTGRPDGLVPSEQRPDEPF